MKKLVILLVIIIIILLGVIVYISIDNKKIDSNENQNIVKTGESNEYESLDPFDPYHKLVEDNKNYKVYTDKSGFNYFYNVYNNNGECVDIGFNGGRGVNFEIIDDILSVRMGFGTYAFVCRYYDLSTNRISRFYTTPLEIGGEYIAYFTGKTENDKDEIILVIQNIFDERVYYKEVKRDFPPAVLMGYSPTQFINNNMQLQITYYIDSDTEEVKTEIIDL